MRIRRRVWIFALVILTISAVLFYYKPIMIEQVIEEIKIEFLNQPEVASP